MVGSLNHLTLATLNLEKSFEFYQALMGFRPLARWDRGAYLLAGGSTWLCLSVVTRRSVCVEEDYTHFAFSVPEREFDSVCARVRSSGATEWKQNKSEGLSLYVLDPDRHKLELHVGDWESRLRACRKHPYDGMQFF